MLDEPTCAFIATVPTLITGITLDVKARGLLDQRKKHQCSMSLLEVGRTTAITDSHRILPPPQPRTLSLLIFPLVAVIALLGQLRKYHSIIIKELPTSQHQVVHFPPRPANPSKGTCPLALPGTEREAAA